MVRSVEQEAERGNWREGREVKGGRGREREGGKKGVEGERLTHYRERTHEKALHLLLT